MCKSSVRPIRIGSWQHSLSIHCLSFSFIQAFSISPLQYPTTVTRSRHSTYTLSEFHAEAPQATASEELVVAAAEGFEPATLRTKGAESTNEPPRPTHHLIL